jgi:hypothetical protein
LLHYNKCLDTGGRADRDTLWLTTTTNRAPIR